MTDYLSVTQREDNPGLAVASCAFGVVAALGWLSLPLLDRFLSLGEPFGSLFAVAPVVVIAVLATLLGSACGIASLLRRRSGSRKRTILALVGISLCLGCPVLVWIVAVVWL